MQTVRSSGKKTYSGSMYWSYATAVIATNDNDYAFAGNAYQGFWFVKVDTNDNISWNRTYAYDNLAHVSPPAFHLIAQTKDNGFILAGTDGQYAWLVKTGSQGNEQWHQRYSYGRFGFVSVAQTNDEGYIAFSDIGLVKVDNSGNVQWSEPYNSADNISSSNPYPPSGTRAWSGIVTKDGGFAVAGSINPPHTSGSYFWAAKFAPESGTSTSPSPEFPTPVTALLVASTIAIVTMVVLAKKNSLSKR